MQIIKQLSIKGLFLPAIALCSLLVSGNAANADTVEYSFTGSVGSMSGALLSSTMNVSSDVTGFFRFDNDTLGVGGNYPGAVDAMTVVIGGYTSSFAPGANTVTIFQNTALGGGLMGDRWKLVTAATGPEYKDFFTPLSFDLEVDREGGGLFSDTSLQNPPSISSALPPVVTATRWRLMFENMNKDVVTVRGTLNSLIATPLPAAVILFGAGLISLVGLGAGGLRNLRWPQV